jgi:hypothetical protein
VEELIALKNIKNAPCYDGINLELIKYALTALHYKFLDLLNICWRNGYILKEQGVAIVISIYKKGNRENCAHYSGICLLCAAYKLHAKIISRRISIISEPLLIEEQNSFRRGRSCMDSIFTIQ